MFVGVGFFCPKVQYVLGLTWLGDALKVKHENEERAEARRQEQASSSGHPHPEARLFWRSPRPLVAASTRFIRNRPAEDEKTLGRMKRLFINCGTRKKKARCRPSNNNVSLAAERHRN